MVFRPCCASRPSASSTSGWSSLAFAFTVCVTRLARSTPPHRAALDEHFASARAQAKADRESERKAPWKMPWETRAAVDDRLTKSLKRNGAQGRSRTTDTAIFRSSARLAYQRVSVLENGKMGRIWPVDGKPSPLGEGIEALPIRRTCRALRVTLGRHRTAPPSARFAKS